MKMVYDLTRYQVVQLLAMAGSQNPSLLDKDVTESEILRLVTTELSNLIKGRWLEYNEELALGCFTWAWTHVSRYEE